MSVLESIKVDITRCGNSVNNNSSQCMKYMQSLASSSVQRVTELEDRIRQLEVFIDTQNIVTVARTENGGVTVARNDDTAPRFQPEKCTGGSPLQTINGHDVTPWLSVDRHSDGRDVTPRHGVGGMSHPISSHDVTPWCSLNYQSSGRDVTPRLGIEGPSQQMDSHDVTPWCPYEHRINDRDVTPRRRFEHRQQETDSRSWQRSHGRDVPPRFRTSVNSNVNCAWTNRYSNLMCDVD